MNTSHLYPSLWGHSDLGRLFDALDGPGFAPSSYPPCDIAVDGEDSGAITIAAPGFAEQDLEVSVQADRLVVRGRAPEREDESRAERRWLHRGIAVRGFERTFRLAEHVEANEVRLDNGMLRIGLTRRVPESLQRRVLPIGGPRSSLAVAGDGERSDAAADAATPQAA